MGEMDIPSFADFLDEMGEERAQKWIVEAERHAQREIGIGYDLANPDDAKRFVSAIFAMNQRATILMLQDYHEWLCKQFGSRALRLI